METRASPKLWTIPPGVPFLDCLARALLGGPLVPGSGTPGFALADATILLPTRRACRALGEALVAANDGAPLLLPRIRALGDVDIADLALEGGLLPGDLAAEFPDERSAVGALPPAISSLERLLALARLIEAWGEKVTPEALCLPDGVEPRLPGSAAMALYLAGDLARLMDMMETEGIDPARLETIVPDGFARYWQIALDFLAIVGKAWPDYLDERGLISPARRRDLLLEMEADRLSRTQPRAPIIAAGSTGSIPATARLLGVISRLPAGGVVLPGLDLDSDEEDWREVLAAPSHPQHSMALLLERIGAERVAVQPLPGIALSAASLARARLAREALRPAPRTDQWHKGTAGPAGADEKAAGGLTLIAARGLEEEALTIAAIMRESAERADETAALVTPDRALARRVCAELMRWGLAVDDSAGIALAATPLGLFARLCAEIMAEGLKPVPLLALLKHPLARLAMAPARLRRAARILEIAVLRGPRLAPTIDALRRRLAGALDDLEAGRDRDLARARLKRADWELAGELLDRLEDTLGGPAEISGGKQPLADLIRRHRALCERLAAGAEEMPLYDGPAGMALAAIFDQAQGEEQSGWHVAPSAYPALFTGLISGQPVRPQGTADARLHILGLLEARLLSFDRLILAGLNEGVWPGEAKTDPWLSRPMRAALGLPAPERRIGLAAHDFVQGFCASQVVLSRSDRRDGDPCGESRWLLRLQAVLPEGGTLDRARAEGEKWLAIARALDAAPDWAPAPAPAPRPPLALRPRRLSVTEIETWNRDPYAIYARHVLGLAPLDALDEAPSAADRGTVIHAALQRFIETQPENAEMAETAAARLLAVGEALFAELPEAPEIKAFWWRRFVRAANWFAAAHETERETIRKSFTERRGKLRIGAPGGDFTLSGRADRIDLLKDGTLAIVDYKTGEPPSENQVASGLIPQLSLEAAMAAKGGFAEDGVAAAPVGRLAYISLPGGAPPGKIRELKKIPPEELAAEALAGLKRKIAAFDNEATPYLSRPHPMFASKYAEYDHLARVMEWARDGAGESE